MPELNVGKLFILPKGTTPGQTCATAIEGAMYYDTNVGSPDGGLCVCQDNSGGFRWDPVDAAIAGGATSPSSTDCGT